jgi:hypothetical protein
MAKKAKLAEPQHDLITQVFEDFLARLAKDGSTGVSVVNRLRETLIDQEEFTASSLRDALFKEDLLP